MNLRLRILTTRGINLLHIFLLFHIFNVISFPMIRNRPPFDYIQYMNLDRYCI